MIQTHFTSIFTLVDPGGIKLADMEARFIPFDVSNICDAPEGIEVATGPFITGVPVVVARAVVVAGRVVVARAVVVALAVVVARPVVVGVAAVMGGAIE